MNLVILREDGLDLKNMQYSIVLHGNVVYEVLVLVNALLRDILEVDVYGIRIQDVVHKIQESLLLGVMDVR